MRARAIQHDEVEIEVSSEERDALFRLLFEAHGVDNIDTYSGASVDAIKQAAEAVKAAPQEANGALTLLKRDLLTISQVFSGLSALGYQNLTGIPVARERFLALETELEQISRQLYPQIGGLEA